MGRIYKDSVLTIAAEASPNCTVGLFESTSYSRHSDLIQVCSSSYINGVGRGDLFYSRVSRRQIGETKGPLSRRAWTLQESLLSCRILRFTKDQVWWHCLEDEWTERDPRGCWINTWWGRASTPRVALGREVERFKDGLQDPLLKWVQYC
jgi:hypothetical protein